MTGLLLVITALLTAIGLLFPLRASRATSSAAPPARPACTPAAPCLAVVVDDLGRDLESLHRLLDLDRDLTLAVLPHARHTTVTLEAIHARGREHLLHLPMVPEDPSKISDEPVVLGRDEPLEPALLECLGRVPAAVGMNNHLGSALTRNPDAMRAVVAEASRRGLFLLDSRTTGSSVLCQIARQGGVRCFERDVFLDDLAHPVALETRWRELVQLARRRGWAVGIAHPLPSSVTGLERVLGAPTIEVRRLSQLPEADGT